MESQNLKITKSDPIYKEFSNFLSFSVRQGQEQNGDHQLNHDHNLKTSEGEPTNSGFQQESLRAASDSAQCPDTHENTLLRPPASFSPFSLFMLDITGFSRQGKENLRA